MSWTWIVQPAAAAKDAAHVVDARQRAARARADILRGLSGSRRSPIGAHRGHVWRSPVVLARPTQGTRGGDEYWPEGSRAMPGSPVQSPTKASSPGSLASCDLKPGSSVITRRNVTGPSCYPGPPLSIATEGRTQSTSTRSERRSRTPPLTLARTTKNGIYPPDPGPRTEPQRRRLRPTDSSTWTQGTVRSPV